MRMETEEERAEEKRRPAQLRHEARKMSAVLRVRGEGWHSFSAARVSVRV